MKMQIRLIFFAVCIAALVPIGVLTAQAKAQIKQCVASPSKTQGHWSWRLIDGRKCWYAGKAVISKSLLRWPAAAPAQAKAKVDAVSAQAKVKVEAAPVSVVAEKRSGPMDAQARMLDDDSFESRWRARVTSE
ncbi:hypothetical protein [Bradyrhizobium sp. 190]|uniref:hypothetical protein n=1 Tax=Bradyrhizobium sp. 190 TaxID=2782658 RepID=UPI001FFAFA6B|nr:hypothetical protein [Bradyrhizobium sp. 190]